ncbi:50S ribosomal protein L30 [Candidatus Halobonum tyrrellensis]|uniref:Large ribosomal subunit protein uL30 n=1 Tax=Candidatus Halobonum tyrrellensis G22 TaxID=1324957 RepID=V4HFQ1_9EURY|nr:50S ribosomal protein L30 [Candidatus Halobonum tyrrellensis]ESP88913.1 50S ribosomal protein L30P [Candidatus Halobonum tyrrellensis G22]
MQAVVQLRGEVDMSAAQHDTLKMLNLHAVNHATLVPEEDTYRGMIAKVNDYVAFGEPSVETVATLLRTRGEPLEGDAVVDDDWVADETDYDDVDALASALVDEETTLREQGLSPAIRLHPPRKGHRGIKHAAKNGGELGYHDDIDGLLGAMR